MMNQLTTNLFLLVITLNLVGCFPATNNRTPTQQSITLEYLNSGYFEKKLSTAMSQKPATIEVKFLNSFSANDIPKRLDTWLTVIGETGGKVQTAPADGERNIVNWVVTLYSVYQELKKELQYKPAQHYNAQLLYRHKNGKVVIEKVLFTRRVPKTHTVVAPQSVVPVSAEIPSAQILGGGKHALLIGIENYRNVPPLRGAINDVKLMQGLLHERFGFQEDDFITLLDEQATHTGIEKAFTTLIERIKPDDFVYIHYSGHGSQTADLNGDERSGFDQTWVSYGTREPERENEIDNYDVLDDEINTWLAAIYAKTDQVILVSDSCHSATVARGEVPVTRGLQRDDRSHILGRIAYNQPKKHQGIHIGAARDQELASEKRGDDGKHYGLFTWHWAKALRPAQVGETWHDVFKRAYTAVVAWRGEAQRPQLEGEAHRQIFGGQLTPPVATVSVTQVNGERVKIQGGVVAGVTVGSVYRRHQPRAAELVDDGAFIEITQVDTFESEGRAVGTFKVGDFVVEESHTYHFEPIKVYLSADYPEDQALLESIHAAAKLPGYVLTNQVDNTDLRLHLLRPKRENGQAIYEGEHDALPQSFPNHPPELWVLTPDQHLLYNNLRIQFDNPKKGVEWLQENFTKLARIREIKALQSKDTVLPVTVQTDIFSPCTTGEDCVPLPHDLGLHRKTGTYPLSEIGERHQGDILTFTLYNQSEQDYYCYLINLSADGAIYAIYPNSEENEEYSLIKAGETLELFKKVLLIMEQSGEETIKLIASKHPIDVLLLEQEAFKQRNLEKALNPLERLLVSAAHGQRGLSRISNLEWVTGQVTFEVK